MKTAFSETFRNPHVQGTFQALGGICEAGIGAGMTLASYGIASPIGWGVMAHGLDNVITGASTAWSGVSRDTATSQLLQKTGMSAQSAHYVDSGLSLVGTLGGAAALQASRAATLSFQLPREIGKMKNIFPKNPNDLLPGVLRDRKGYIYASDHIRIKPEKHLFRHGEIYNPRHHGQHYHIEMRTDISKSWNNENYTYYLQPNNYQKGTGTGFIPGETFPGVNK